MRSNDLKWEGPPNSNCCDIVEISKLNVYNLSNNNNSDNNAAISGRCR